MTSKPHSELAAHLRRNGCSQCAEAADLVEQLEAAENAEKVLREAWKKNTDDLAAEYGAINRELQEQLEATRAALLPFAEAANEKLPVDAVLRAREVLYPASEPGAS